MADLVSGIFSRVESMQSSSLPVSGRVTPSVLQMGSRLMVSPPASVSGDEAETDQRATDSVAAALKVDENGVHVVLKVQGTETEVSIGETTTVVEEERNGTEINNAVKKEEVTTTTATNLENTPNIRNVPSHHEIVSLLSPAPARALTPFETIIQESDHGGDGDGGYGIESLCEVLSFVISFVAAPPSRQHTGLPAHGLDLVLAALHAGGAAIAAHEPLIALLRQDLVKALFSAAKGASLACLSGICQVALALYAYLNRHFLLQLEALLSLLLLPIAEGRGSSGSVEAQQIALEGVLDFCSQPGFVKDMYLNLDCRIERSNLFEQICTLLSKAAFPVNGPVSAVHVLSLDGIIAILASLGAACENLVSLEDEEEEGKDGSFVSGKAAEDSAAVAVPKEPEGFLDIWTPLAQGIAPSAILQDKPEATAAEIARAEKLLKGRLTSVAEHFNRDAKKGFQLCQSMHLLPPTLDPGSVARFLRCCPGLAKPCIGEVLGERDTFYDQVRDAFSKTFDFSGLEFDTALRLFMDAFRPPGEGQKIDRIMQTFGKRYYEQNSNGGLKSADAAYVLAFSVIMLNTDLHNTQNKKKMSLKDFNRINDNTNDGAPMPKELLQHIYTAISADELKISSECAPEELPAQLVFWQRMSRDAQRPRGQMVFGAQPNAGIERDMFALIWGPTLAAVSVILDGSSDPGISRRAMDGLLVAARLATHHGLPDVGDQLLSTLAKYTAAALSADVPKPALVFGESVKGRAAVEATFSIANRYGDNLRGGWRYVLECIVRLHKLGLLPAAAIAADGEDLDDARRRLPTPNLSASKKASSSLFSRAINSLISIEGTNGAGGEEATAREEALMAAALESAEVCRVDDLIADSKFLTAESLVELVKATMWAGGNVVAAARTGEGSDTAELALEILITLALRNRDRISLIWPLVHEYIAACLSAESAEQATPLVERAVAGLFRVSQRLLPYKEDTAEMLLASLQLAVSLPQGAAWSLAEGIATDVLGLVKSSGPYIHTETDWRTIAALIRLTSARPEAVPAAFEALSMACRDPGALSSESYMPLLETSLQLIDRYKGSHPEAAVRFLDCADALFTWLPAQKTIPASSSAVAAGSGATSITIANSSTTSASMSDEALVDLWLTSVGVMARGLCREDVKQLRDTSITTLHRTLIASAPLNLPAELWVQTTKELIIPLVSDLAKLAASLKAVKARPGLEKSVCLAVNMLTKVLLQYVPLMAADRDFYALWNDALTALQSCMAIKQEAVMESVPENVKNLLMVLANSRVLVPGWSEESFDGAEGRSLWDLTWSKAGGISSGLNPGMLNAAGILNGGGGDMAGPAVPAVPVATNTAAAVSAPVENGSVASPPVAPAAIDPAPAPAVVEEQAAIEEEEEEEEAPPACKQS
jgi:brefeldin A-resistance guanine nucleotide exchange factor 1